MTTIRKAGPEDIPALHALVERAYRGDSARQGWTHEADLLGGQRTDREALAAALADPTGRILVAEHADGAVIGCVHVSAKPGRRAHLAMLSVDPDRQGAGLGKALITAAEGCAAAVLAAEAVEMTVIRQRPELIAYYLRRGYRATGREQPFPYGDERFGLPRRSDLVFVVLEKRLDP